MGLKSTQDRYGAVAIAIHWITAAMIVALIALGLNAASATDDSARRALLLPHIALGLLTLALTLFRIAWWAFADRKPARPAGVPLVQLRIAEIVHMLIYAAIIALAASGIATNVVGGVIAALTSGTPIPDLDALAPRQAHGLLARLFLLLLTIHIAAALYHHFVRRDGLLARMGIGKART
ncbi:cytochrome b [Pelagibacterium halotolerans]|uniref:Cytochrome B561 n=1 Tax=Pelagibacterium halotolerans (strain DSM 22347 / JCM 15775 / CGMCC 1.7692 / B2) TaxID=1082931 RepID=G4RGT4_PELHB|nr:cytochrome b/b6 domain-containing protein [Pelagibacterium halotolerans]AEQ52123.1 cytochrome B561 [Pelagibacterium halotolerans B2]QJR18108.1 cytochrome B [Pelagibacterium halotolerans]SDZ84015.1 cytochrome b561 [Pelagibacterium halotolerans]